MNIFEALGLPSNHRSKDKCTMKVKNFDEVPDSKKPRRGVYYGQIKKDGIFCHVMKTEANDYFFFSRTGMELRNTDLLRIHCEVYGESMEPGVYMTELCCDQCSLEALSGIFNPNRTKVLCGDQVKWCRDSYLAFHDYVTLDEFIVGLSEFNYSVRYKKLLDMIPAEFELLHSDYIHIDDIYDYARQHINVGEEGVVIKRVSETWQAGHKGYKAMKIVRGVDYDLLCIGVEEGTGKYKGKVGNLIFRWKDGKEVKAMLGKGWTHQDAADMFSNYMCSQADSPIGKIFQVYALQESSKGVLRLPKIGELRHDKEEADI